MATSNESTPKEEFTTLNLQNDITISNATNTWNFKAGQNVQVPAAMAEDVSRMDYEHQLYKDNLLKRRVFEERGPVISVGNGAE